MSCVVCLRDHRGPQFTDPVPDPFGPKPKPQRACSMGHLDVILMFWKAGKMFDPTPYERAALLIASDAAGEFLEATGKTDLATLSPEEWRSFLEVIFLSSTREIARLTDEDAVPF